jgi:coenzyme F420 biosynthesis associated uncharacterized protein
MTSATATAPIDQLVDWELAARTAAVVGRPGPQVSREQAAQAVAELHRFSADSVAHIAAVSGLRAPGDVEVAVIDRASWARANALSFRDVLAPTVAELVDRRGRVPGQFAVVGSRVTAAEVGSLLGFLSSRVLGQYDPFGPGPSRLLLVAPNVMQVESELGVDHADFRRWVCLHEETHRVQFTANPWLAEYLLGEVRGLVGDLLGDPAQLLTRLRALAGGLPELIRTGAQTSVLDLVQTAEQRARLARVTAVMSLLEGHADVMMDEVGPEVVPTVRVIRDRFSRRRAGRGALDQLLRRLLGLEAKMRQYADGARFVREVRASVGLDGFNAVWSAPETLPLPTEIADPQVWVSRVHG